MRAGLALWGLLLWGLQLLAAEDPWAPGYRLDAWDRIQRLQSCPLTVRLDPSDLQALCMDSEPLVRAAAALACGRLGETDLIPALVPLLQDDAQLVRASALWALLRVQDERIKAPLLEVVSSWPDLEPSLAVLDSFHLFSRVGLPQSLASMSLERRQAWVAQLDAAAWKVTFDDSQSPTTYGNGRLDITVFPSFSEWDAGAPLKLTVVVEPVGRREALQFRLTEGTGAWFAVGDRGEVSGQDMDAWRLFFPQGLAGLTEHVMLDITPDTPVIQELTLSPERRPLPPGVYLFCAFRSMCPVLVRVCRSPSFERGIPELIGRVPEREAVKTLGQQRVLAAVPALVKAFELGKDGFAVAEALARIGDPEAVSVLLDRPFLRDGDVVGDTSRALKIFGAAAYPCFEERIIHWERELRENRAHGLSISLQLLGSNAAERARSARLEIVRTLAVQVDDSRTQESGERMRVLQAALAAAASSDPTAVVDAIWRAADKPEASAALVSGLRNLAPQTARPVAVELWRRTSREPQKHLRLRDALTQVLGRVAPEVLVADEQPLQSETEALRLLEAARHDASPPDRVVARVKGYSGSDPRLRVKLALARFLFCLERFQECETILRENEAAFTEDWQQVPACYCLGQILIARGELQGGKEYLQRALSLARPDHHYEDICGRSVGASAAHGLKIVETMLANPGVRFQEHEMLPLLPAAGHVYMEVADGRGFYIDMQRRLCSWDPLTRASSVFGVMPQEVRDFMPLDENRVFVAFLDGSSALYELGRETPLWKRPLALSFDSFLTASPSVIMAADEEGTLHALSPLNGETQWTRRVTGKRWPQNWWRSDRGLISLHDGFVLVPDSVSAAVTAFEWIEVATGKTLWSFRPGADVDKVALSRNRGFFASSRGSVEAVDLADGSVAWRIDVGKSVALPYNELEVATGGEGDTVYVGMQKTVWGIEAASGKRLWQWEWTPAPGADRFGGRDFAWPRLRATTEGAFLVFNWETGLLSASSPRTDVVRFSKTGEVVCRAASPQTRREFADTVFLAGDRLVLRKGSRWEIWEAATRTADR
jgi:hypothetical protein